MRDNARAISARYETRVGSPLDFQPKRVSAPNCFRARCAALKQVVAHVKHTVLSGIESSLPH
ncbi:hypothetical protein CGSMWGv1500E_04166 [Gardnerella vaginalis 1500E]|uniref:Uncharacterized protein n=1 Tax=Gardnerella vaginalis 1500E TaxID=698957 RepID=I4LZI2_GARVA|nr:hypothetical protein CGSMWGv1500E_04166 [Gardnerella vaginalis 1500E]